MTGSDEEKRPILLLGAGGHARVVLDMIRLRGLEIRGVISPDVPAGTSFHGITIHGDDAWVLDHCPPETVHLVNGIGSIGSPVRRKAVYEHFKARGYRFAAVVHPSAVVAGDAVLGEGSQVMAGAVIQPGAVIGENTIINTRASIDHDCRIGPHVHIAPGVTISGEVRIDQGTHVGTGASVIQGRHIREESLVGAGSVVVRDVGEQLLVVGVPARAVRSMKDWRKVLVRPGTSVREVIAIIDSQALRIALIVDETLRLLGCVTDGDIRRGILRGVSLDEAVEKIMNPRPRVVRKEESGERILRLMQEQSIHHVPVVDERGCIIRLELIENFLPRKAAAEGG